VQTLSEIRERLALHGLAPSRALGQNFLVDQNLLRRLVDEAERAGGPLDGAAVLEIGPGTGTLTEELLARGARVVACELDRGLAGLLREVFAEPLASGRLRLVEGDCLAGRAGLNPEIWAALGDEPFRLVANLPYGAGSPVMALLARASSCAGQFVTIQREVAERLRAGPGSRAYGELAVVVRARARVERIATLAPECFWPRPKVTSEMVSIVPLARPLTDDVASLTRLCETLFRKRRKQLGSILGRDVAWPDGVAPTMRPEALPVESLVALAEAWDGPGDGRRDEP
jgi:16S rRNA (adenine1518-N6/adenine1519-N6)-dimethyltransferase